VNAAIIVLFLDASPRLRACSKDGLVDLEEAHGQDGELQRVVDLLKRARHDELAKGMSLRCNAADPQHAERQRKAKAAYVHKLYRAQRYLQRCEEDMRYREAKLEKLAK
jgi:hypothetical protein